MTHQSLVKIAFMSMLLTFLGPDGAHGEDLCASIFDSASHPMTGINTSLAEMRENRNLEKRIHLDAYQKLILEKAQVWREQIRLAERNSDFMKTNRILDEIATYAGTLIWGHKNQEFFFLASQIEFPMNKRTYEDETGFLRYGRYLLTDAILSKNYEVYDRLNSLARDFKFKFDDPPRIARWTQRLAKTVAEDARFSRDILTIMPESGSQFNHRMANYGRLTPRALETLHEIEKSKSTLDLFKVLSDIFSAGSLDVKALHKQNLKTNASLDFNHTGYEDRKDPWLQMSIADSKDYVNSIIFAGHYKKISKFNLQLYKVNFQKETPFLAEFRFLKPGETNWIAEMEVQPEMVRILLERDKEGQFYDRGTKFQELTLQLDKATGRITHIQIKNGDRLLLKALWQKQVVEISKNTSGSTNIYFLGEEDLSAQDISF